MLDMTRRYGTGTVFWHERRQKWVGQWSVHDGTERRKRRTVSAATEAECWRKLNKARSTSAALPGADERLTVGTFLRQWLRDTVTPSVRARTADNYRSMIDTHIAPSLGGHKLSRLSVLDVERYRNAKLAEGLSPRSVSHHLATLRAALGKAEAWGMVTRNVAALVRGPSVTAADIRPLTTAQGRALLDAVAGDRWEAVYSLALLTGMRQGEILGLRWGDIDLDARRLTIRKSLVWLHGKPLLEDPKTDRSRRSLRLPLRTVAALRWRQGAQEADRATCEAARAGHWHDVDLVFSDEHGDAVRRDIITREFQRHLKAASLPHQRFHDLRHATVGILLELGMTMREIADVLGHAKPSMTSDVYSHLEVDATDRAADLMDGAMS